MQIAQTTLKTPDHPLLGQFAASGVIIFLGATSGAGRKSRITPSRGGALLATSNSAAYCCKLQLIVIDSFKEDSRGDPSLRTF